MVTKESRLYKFNSVISKSLRESRSVDERTEVNRLLDETIELQNRKTVNLSNILIEKRQVTQYERDGYSLMMDWIGRLISLNNRKSSKLLQYIKTMTLIDSCFTNIKERTAFTEIEEIVSYLERDYERSKELKLQSYLIEQETQFIESEMNKGKQMILNSMDNISHELAESKELASKKHESFTTQQNFIDNLKLRYESLTEELISSEPVLLESYRFFLNKKANRAKFNDVPPEFVGLERIPVPKYLGTLASRSIHGRDRQQPGAVQPQDHGVDREPRRRRSATQPEQAPGGDRLERQLRGEQRVSLWQVPQPPR